MPLSLSLSPMILITPFTRKYTLFVCSSFALFIIHWIAGDALCCLSFQHSWCQAKLEFFLPNKTFDFKEEEERKKISGFWSLSGNNFFFLFLTHPCSISWSEVVQDILFCLIMACSLKSVFCVPELNESMLGSKSKGVFRLCPSTHGKARSSSTYSGHPYSVLSTDFMGKPIVLPEEKGSGYCSSKTSRDGSIHVHYEALLLSGFSTFRFPIMFSLFSPLLTFNLIFFFGFRHKQQFVLAKLWGGGRRTWSLIWLRSIQHKNWCILCSTLVMHWLLWISIPLAVEAAKPSTQRYDLFFVCVCNIKFCFGENKETVPV